MIFHLPFSLGLQPSVDNIFFLIISIYFASMGIFMLRLLRIFWIILGNVELYIAIVVYEFDIVKPVLAVTPGEWSYNSSTQALQKRGVVTKWLQHS